MDCALFPWVVPGVRNRGGLVDRGIGWGLGIDDFTLYLGTGFPSAPSLGFPRTTTFRRWESDARLSALANPSRDSVGLVSPDGVAMAAFALAELVVVVVVVEEEEWFIIIIISSDSANVSTIERR